MTKQNGNILFLILIAVALFAALSYAVVTSDRGTADISKEKAKLDQSINENCVANVEQGLLRIKIVNGCTADEISYELADGTNSNPLAPSDHKCHVFRGEGGGAYPCGAYLDPIVPLGTILAGDTTTVALTPSGVYFKCLQWPFTTLCQFAVSEDGINFPPSRDKLCTKKGDGSDNHRASNGNPYYSGFAHTMCNAACGSGASGYGGVAGGAPEYYLEDDSTITPYTGSCDYIMRQVTCPCFN